MAEEVRKAVRSLPAARFYDFGPFRLDSVKRSLGRAGEPVALPPKAIDTLLRLLQEAGQLVTKDELMAAVWPDTVVEENNLTQSVSVLRRTLGERPDGTPYIETVARRGYRFRANVVEASVPRAPHRRATVLGAVAAIALALGLGVWVRSSLQSPGRSSVRSLAVLPLENLSGDPAQEYFADGMTDELTTRLARIGALRVISRTSSMQFRGSHKRASQIARELNVDALVEGSVARSGNKVRITAQLIDARRDVHLWAQSYEREIGEVLEVQDSVALDIASQVKASLSPEEREILTAQRTVKPEAYEACLRGLNEIEKQTQDSIKESTRDFERAIEIDPLYARAYAGLADSYELQADRRVMAPREAFPRGEQAARRALELDPASAEAHASLAFARHHFDWDWAGAGAEYRRAIELNPGYPAAHTRYAEYLSNIGRHEEALREIRRAQELDPLSLAVRVNVGRVLFWARRYDEAIQELQKVLAADPGRVFARIHLGLSYEQKRMYPEAVAEFERLTTMVGPGPGLAHAYASSGRTADARRILRDLERPSPDGSQDWFFIAGVHAALGENDRAFEWLDRAYQNRDYFMPHLQDFPYMDPLRSDPRYTDLVKRVGIP
jgi:TolB-like protein/DNA-binding winged helix-turn-helix (wHTH) protein/Tfp pilus assembly protein PilF